MNEIEIRDNKLIVANRLVDKPRTLSLSRNSIEILKSEEKTYEYQRYVDAINHQSLIYQIIAKKLKRKKRISAGIFMALSTAMVIYILTNFPFSVVETRTLIIAMLSTAGVGFFVDNQFEKKLDLSDTMIEKLTNVKTEVSEKLMNEKKHLEFLNMIKDDKAEVDVKNDLLKKQQLEKVLNEDLRKSYYALKQELSSIFPPEVKQNKIVESVNMDTSFEKGKVKQL